MLWSRAVVCLIVSLLVGTDFGPYLWEACLQYPQQCFMLGWTGLIFGTARWMGPDFGPAVYDYDVEDYDLSEDYYNPDDS